MENAVGVLGGVGPLATVYFMNMIINMTDAETDQQHINMLVSNHATIPDRTEYILKKSKDSPLEAMIDDARMLEAAGCKFIVVPCNTTHYFFEDIKNSVEIPVLNIIKEAILYALELGKIKNPDKSVKKLGILATEGTVLSGTYSFYGKSEGIECIAPDDEYQKKVNHMIYDCVKAGRSVSLDEIQEVITHMREKGCDGVIMGCTELSVIYEDLNLEAYNDDVVDSLTALARRTVLECGKKLR